MAARNPPESGTRPGPFRRDTRPTDWLPEIYETKVTATESRLSFFLFCGGFSPARRFHLASSSDAEGTIQFQRHVHDEDGTSASSCSRVLFLPRAPRNERLGKQRRPVDFLRRQEKHHIYANNLISRRISQPSDTTGQRAAGEPTTQTGRWLVRPRSSHQMTGYSWMAAPTRLTGQSWSINHRFATSGPLCWSSSPEPDCRPEPHPH